MQDSDIENGARQAVVNCVRVQPGEAVAVITDIETRSLAEAIVRQVEQVGATASLFVMEDFGPRPREGGSPLAWPEAMGQALARAQASFYVAQCRQGELASFRRPMLQAVQRLRLRHAHMPGFTAVMMGQGMATDYAQVQELCRKVYDRVRPASRIRVTTPAGTDLTATFDTGLKWLISDGLITPEQWKNLPDGEVFTAPADANGQVVVDGCLGDFFCEKYGLIRATPVTYKLEDGRCVGDSIRCDNPQLLKEFRAYTLETDTNSMRIGEFAIGTNIGLTGLIGNLLQDEKYPGVHLALGSPYPDKTGAQWDSEAHNDGVLLSPTILVEGEPLMVDGRFLV